MIYFQGGRVVFVHGSEQDRIWCFIVADFVREISQDSSERSKKGGKLLLDNGLFSEQGRWWQFLI